MTSAPTLSGKRVLVTGGAGAVGAAVARLMAAQGARLLLSDRDERDLREVANRIRSTAGSGEIETIAADLSKPAGPASIFERVDAWLGGLDILVACTGVGAAPLMESSEQEWRNVIETNLVSYVACTQGAIERIRAAGIDDGMVILVGSISVHIKAVGESVYNASKGGVALFAETLRKEMIPDRIRVTLIEPGAINSAMQPYPSDERARFVEQHRMLPPEQVAEAILFAATRPAGVDVVTLRIEPLDQKIW